MNEQITRLTTSEELFDVSPAILQSTDSNGFTHEENLLLDASVLTLFYNSLADWEIDAAWYRKHGYCIYDIIQMTDGRIAVLTV